MFLRTKKKAAEDSIMSSSSSSTTKIRPQTACPDNPEKKGFYACLESSMNVPGAAGPPVKLLRSCDWKKKKNYSDDDDDDDHQTAAAAATTGKTDDLIYDCFDAFCYEAIPYRSAVETGNATHILALRSRPDGCHIDTSPTTYETIVAPNYFRKHNLPEVAYFFEQQGSQYRYLEDILTLDEGLVQGCTTGEPVLIPPTKILSGTNHDDTMIQLLNTSTTWNKAHLLPIVCKANTPELPSLTQDKEQVVNAVREGFIAAFEVLAPLVLNVQNLPDARTIAELVFPMQDYLEELEEDDDDDNNNFYYDILQTPVRIKGDTIIFNEANNNNNNNNLFWQQQEQLRNGKRQRLIRWMKRMRLRRRRSGKDDNENENDDNDENNNNINTVEEEELLNEAEAILAALPGFQNGRLYHLAGPLRRY